MDLAALAQGAANRIIAAEQRAEAQMLSHAGFAALATDAAHTHAPATYSRAANVIGGSSG
jgi:hypothetical protein